MKIAWAIPVLLPVLATCPGRTAELTRFEFSEPHMGTNVRLVLYAQNAESAAAASKAAFAQDRGTEPDHDRL